MADHETIAAILTAGTLPTVAAPRGHLTEWEEKRVHEALADAVALYRATLEALV